MKTLSGRDFARLAERRGWQLLRVTAAITFTESPAVSCAVDPNSRKSAAQARLQRHLAKLAEIPDEEMG